MFFRSMVTVSDNVSTDIVKVIGLATALTVLGLSIADYYQHGQVNVNVMAIVSAIAVLIGSVSAACLVKKSTEPSQDATGGAK